VVPNGSCGQGDSPQSSINGTHSKLWVLLMSIKSLCLPHFSWFVYFKGSTTHCNTMNGCYGTIGMIGTTRRVKILPIIMQASAYCISNFSCWVIKAQIDLLNGLLILQGAI
jgi:hypothetical protein